MAYDIAVIPGDGIGREVIDATLPLLSSVAGAHDSELRTTKFDWSSERYLDEGAMMPDDGTEQLEDFDAILLGAVGHPDVPDHVTLRGLMLPIRKAFQQGICVRPAVLYEGVESPPFGATTAVTSTSLPTARTPRASTPTSAGANTGAPATRSRFRPRCSPERVSSGSSARRSKLPKRGTDTSRTSRNRTPRPTAWCCGTRSSKK